jgi:hypothetical protein
MFHKFIRFSPLGILAQLGLPEQTRSRYGAENDLLPRLMLPFTVTKPVTNRRMPNCT